MSLVPVTVDIERTIDIDDYYGGAVAQTTVKYVGLQAWINYPNPRREDRSESITTQGAMAGPGVVTVQKAFLKFEPIPTNITIEINDVVSVRGGFEWDVVGIRTYEYTQQIDLERVY